jgi:hypothetical protein
MVLKYKRKNTRKNTRKNKKIHGGKQNLDIIPICIYSHSSVEDVLEIQFDYMSKISNMSNQKIYLFIDKPYTKETSLKYQTILYDDNTPYSKRLIKCISEILEPYFILSHENDILVGYDPNTILELKRSMEKNIIDSITLKHFPKCTNLIQVNNSLSLFNPDPDYVFNVQPRLWKKTSALNLFTSIPDKNYKTIESANTESYIKSNQKTYTVCSSTPVKSTRDFIVIPEYKYIHITSGGKFIINKQKIDKNIEIIYSEIYNRYIKNSRRGTIEY